MTVGTSLPGDNNIMAYVMIPGGLIINLEGSLFRLPQSHRLASYLRDYSRTIYISRRCTSYIFVYNAQGMASSFQMLLPYDPWLIPLGV